MAVSLKVIDSKMAASDKQADKATAERAKALEAALAQIDRAFGKGSAMKLGSKQTMQVEVISTGSLGSRLGVGVIRRPLVHSRAMRTRQRHHRLAARRAASTPAQRAALTP